MVVVVVARRARVQARKQVGAQSQLTSSSTRPRKERVKARGAIRYDALDTSNPEEGALGLSSSLSDTPPIWQPLPVMAGLGQRDIDTMSVVSYLHT